MAEVATSFKKRKSPEKHLRSKQRNIIRRQARREKAESLLKERAKLSPWQQMERLDWRLGLGSGAVKERKRLASQMV
jgi:hypothetical protein